MKSPSDKTRCYTPGMLLEYQKMLGAGNRILIVDQRQSESVSPDSRVLSALKEYGPTAEFDQLMWLKPASDSACIAGYRVFNTDGSEVEQCGNGARCVAALLAAKGQPENEFLLESPAGVVAARIDGRNRASVSMGAPAFEDEPRSIEVDKREIDVNIVSMGNPHCVLDVADVATSLVELLGPAIERHESFPGRINVGFMHIVDRGNIDLRVFERGAGETLACGTGACAAVASGRRRGLLDEEVAVHLPGGQLVVSWRGGDEAMWLSGDTQMISEGQIEI